MFRRRGIGSQSFLFYNLAGASTALLLRRPPNLRAIGALKHTMLLLRNFARSYDKTSRAICNRSPEVVLKNTRTMDWLHGDEMTTYMQILWNVTEDWLFDIWGCQTQQWPHHLLKLWVGIKKGCDGYRFRILPTLYLDLQKTGQSDVDFTRPGKNTLWKEQEMAARVWQWIAL